ncbi:MAG TPA: 3-dehydroquinate synthase [Rhodospirillales bacterium]|nr:3-dehydroquinate synthase [Rhodospirillales bacterium]
MIGEGLLDKAGEHLAPLMAGGRAIIITDDTVAPLYLDRVMGSLQKSGIGVSSVIIPAGEASKKFSQLQDLTDSLFRASVDRSTMIVALGGGVIGDLAGFAAAITMRGLPLVQIPTTLLAQVDSSVGGKTGINSSFGKNLIGAFHQPALVLIDPATLDTLPRRQLLAGYAEMVKYGLIGDADFFQWLESNGTALLDGDKAALRHGVLKSCAAKAAIVAEDELEHGRRALLNLGHTFGHALEAETGYGEELLHGEAVAIGMVMAFDYSARSGLCPESAAKKVTDHLKTMGLPVDLKNLVTRSWGAERLITHMGLDKKVDNGTLVFILARDIGQAFISGDVAHQDLTSYLNDFING